MVDHHRSLPTCYYCHCHHAATASPRIDQLRTTIKRGWRGLAGSDVFLDRVQVVLFGRLCADIALVENNNRKTRVGYSVQTGSLVLPGIKPRRCSKILRRSLNVGTFGENNRRRQSSGPKPLSFSQEVINRSLFGRDRDSIPRFDCEQRLSA